MKPQLKPKHVCFFFIIFSRLKSCPFQVVFRGTARVLTLWLQGNRPGLPWEGGFENDTRGWGLVRLCTSCHGISNLKAVHFWYKLSKILKNLLETDDWWLWKSWFIAILPERISWRKKKRRKKFVCKRVVFLCIGGLHGCPWIIISTAPIFIYVWRQMQVSSYHPAAR